MQQSKVIIAKINNSPPSFFTSIPNTNKCDKMEPSIFPAPNKAAIKAVLGTKIKIEANNLTIPELILPKGSMINLVKM